MDFIGQTPRTADLNRELIYGDQSGGERIPFRDVGGLAGDFYITWEPMENLVTGVQASLLAPASIRAVEIVFHGLASIDDVDPTKSQLWTLRGHGQQTDEIAHPLDADATATQVRDAMLNVNMMQGESFTVHQWYGRYIIQWDSYDDPATGGASTPIDTSSFSIGGDVTGYVREVPWTHDSEVEVFAMVLDPSEKIQAGTFGVGLNVSGFETRMTTKCRSFRYTNGNAATGTHQSGDPLRNVWFTTAEYVA